MVLYLTLSATLQQFLGGLQILINPNYNIVQLSIMFGDWRDFSPWLLREKLMMLVLERSHHCRPDWFQESWPTTWLAWTVGYKAETLQRWVTQRWSLIRTVWEHHETSGELKLNKEFKHFDFQLSSAGNVFRFGNRNDPLICIVNVMSNTQNLYLVSDIQFLFLSKK